jgi:class 3 adenylate cyclase
LATIARNRFIHGVWGVGAIRLPYGRAEPISDVAGIAVSIGARVAGQAQLGEVLVSQTVKDLVAGSGLAFVDQGTAELKGVPGKWRLYAVADAAD